MQNEKNEDHEIWSLVLKRWKNKQILSETGSRFKGPRGLLLPKLPSTTPTPPPPPPRGDETLVAGKPSDTHLL